MNQKLFLALWTLVIFLWVSPVAAATGGCVAVVGDSDLHGALEPTLVPSGGAVGDKATQKSDSRQTVRVGGLGAIAAYMSILRDRFGARLVFVSAGDLYQGTLASNLSRGRAVVEALSLLGLVGTAIGNHDFDYGPLSAGDPDVQGVLKKRIDNAAFPFFSLNVYDAATHRRIAWPGTRPSILVDAGQRQGGLKVGIIGASGTDTPLVTRPEFVAGLEFPDPVPLIVAEARQLRVRGAELVVLAAHFGGKCDDLGNPYDTSSCDPQAELFRVLRALPAGTVDVAIGGHTHARVAHYVNGTLAMQAGARGRTLSFAEVCTRQEGGIDPTRTTLHGPLALCLEVWQNGRCDRRKSPPGEIVPATFLGQPVAPQKAMAELLAPYLAAAKTKVAALVGITLPQPLWREKGEPRLGDLVALAAAELSGADFGIQNLGGVRADLPAGELRFGQIFRVLPFGNQLGVVTLTGAQVEAFVMQLIRRRQKPPFLAGLAAEAAADGYRIKVTDGSTLLPDRSYTLATSDFLLGGGEGLDALLAEVPARKRKILDQTLRDALLRLLRSRYPTPR